MPEEPRSDGVASVSGGIAAELAAAGFEEARQVARGGAGVIYCCYETALGRSVAVKVLPSHIDEDSRERFLREGYAMGVLSGHPNIVNILRVGMTASKRPFIGTKLVGMPTPRGSYGATYIDGRIVVVGGEEPTMVLDVVEMYDISAGKWSTIAPMPTARHAEVVATVGNTVYCIGGADRPTHEGPIATVEALDFR
ncbi:hypothetical protein A5705_01620 [Mycobacterium sp. E787]|nr:hypothetical protein A5705_01620 [Mycobacterium sp. E787]